MAAAACTASDFRTKKSLIMRTQLRDHDSICECESVTDSVAAAALWQEAGGRRKSGAWVDLRDTAGEFTLGLDLDGLRRCMAAVVVGASVDVDRWLRRWYSDTWWTRGSNMPGLTSKPCRNILGPVHTMPKGNGREIRFHQADIPSSLLYLSWF
jgi:hypothetical protein